MRFEFLKEHMGEIGPIKKACGLMKVSRSGFYEYLGRRKSNAQIEREALEGFVAEAFERHKGRCGYRRINRELRKSGIVVSACSASCRSSDLPERARPGNAASRRRSSRETLG